jgi:hypothetical protein
MMMDGRFVVSDEIQIMIEGELVEQRPAEADSGRIRVQIWAGLVTAHAPRESQRVAPAARY